MKCNECGTRREEWEDDRNVFNVETDRCIGCEKIAWEQHSWAEEPHAAYGVKFRLVRPDDETAVRMRGDGFSTRR